MGQPIGVEEILIRPFAASSDQAQLGTDVELSSGAQGLLVHHLLSLYHACPCAGVRPEYRGSGFVIDN